MLLRARYVMYALTTGFTYTNYMTWYGLIFNNWITFAAKANDWNGKQAAMLMSSFATGYVPIQVSVRGRAPQLLEHLTCAQMCTSFGTLRAAD